MEKIKFRAIFFVSRWNWEEVILSRNGPSTTTSPRPKTWTTTTLRNFDVAPVRGEGSVGTVEDANIVPRRKAPSDDSSTSSSAHPAVVASLSVPVMIAALLLSNLRDL